MRSTRRQSGFTFVEALIVVSLMMTLLSILIPSLSRARQLAQRANCIGTLHGLGRAAGQYLAQNKDTYWPGAIPGVPQIGVVTYFWGTPGDPVLTEYSPFMKYVDHKLSHFQCPSLPWGTYKPQGNVKVPTTCYGYNAYCLDSPSYVWKWDGRVRTKKGAELADCGALFVFADSALYWKPFDTPFFQNSTHLEPPIGPPLRQPTTHFRHLETTCALSADGHAAYYGLEGGELVDSTNRLGFVGAENMPHYDITNTPYHP
jgi:type II secretory pathway pseudopilin PulG